jgi:cation diffusion facilitator CzcD-associated flavoprotein CzcO
MAGPEAIVLLCSLYGKPVFVLFLQIDNSVMKPDVDVAIIGAGFAGLGAAVRLKQQGNTSFVVFERAAEVGGTWRDNVYPGCACDVPSHLYSLSFAPNPNWSRMYSPQPEILNYLKNVVDTYQLAPTIRYNTEITRTKFSESDGFWTLTDRAGSSLTARVVIGALGPLNRPYIPKLNGIGYVCRPSLSHLQLGP